MAAMREFEAEENSRSAHYRELSLEQLDADFASYCIRERERAEGKHLPEGYVPDSIYWLVDGGRFIGRVSIRHRSTPRLLESGGHVGYDIRPSERKKGYGTEILRLALPQAKALGLKRVLLTCDESNIGSRKIIEKNGGRFQDKVQNPAGGPDKSRYWIDL